MWETYEAFEKKAACDSGLVKAQSRFESLALRQKKLGMDARMVFLQCLPDTVDPRGPKGGK